jgi:hypothetical protein
LEVASIWQGFWISVISYFQVKGTKMKNRNTTSFLDLNECHKRNWLISKMEEDSLKEFTSALSFLALLRK